MYFFYMMEMAWWTTELSQYIHSVYTPLCHDCKPMMSMRYMVAEVLADMSVTAWNGRYTCALVLYRSIATVVPFPG